MGEGEIGADNAGRADTREAEDPEPAHPAMKNSAAQTAVISEVWPTSGWSTSGVTVAPSSSMASRFAGISGRLALSAKSQAARTTKAGLRNSEGCRPMPAKFSQRRAPLISAPMKRVATTRTSAPRKATKARRRIQ